MPIDPSIISAGIGAASSVVSSIFGKHKNEHVDPSGLSNSTGGDLLKIISDGIKNKSLNFGSLVDAMSNLAKDKGYYANSALNYYLENQAFEKQLDYNLKAMEKQFQYQNTAMQKQYEYGKQSMADQYQYDVNMLDKSTQRSLMLQNKQNAWSEMMSNTSHQREVADLRAAGLNPILSANSGANAYTSGSAIIHGNTPSQAMPSTSAPGALPISKPDYSKVLDSLYRGIQARNDTKVANAEAAKKMKEAENLDWTDEGIRRRAANAVKNFIEGEDYSLDVNGVIKNLTNGEGSNSFQKFKSDFSSQGLLKAVGHFFQNNYKDYSDWMHSIKSNTINKRNSYTDPTPKNLDDLKPPSYIPKDEGLLIDIDSYLRNKYNTSKKIRR